MEFVIWGSDFRHRRGEFCQRITSELYFISRFRTDYMTEVDGELIRGRAGDILIAHPGDVIYHGPTPEMTEGFSNDWIKLSGEDLGELLANYPLPHRTPFRIPDPDLITRCIEEITDEHSRMRAGYHEMCECSLRRTVIALHRAVTTASNLTAEDKLDSLRHRLIAECEHPWTLAEMAESTGYSTSRFSTLYKARFNASPIDDLISIRIERAKLLLRHGAMTVEEVSEHTGFSSIYYFSRIFRERIGTSPTAWITNNGKDI